MNMKRKVDFAARERPHADVPTLKSQKHPMSTSPAAGAPAEQFNKMLSVIQFPKNRLVDLACLGRLAVDMYAQQFGSHLEDTRSMAMYLGGSSANLAF
ncbi:MAG: hypothetical protein RL323_1809, partial [Pseudomonadota bacterium]